MKIALVEDFLYTYGGAERVLKIFHELFPTAPIYTAFADPEIVNTHFPDAEIHTSYLQKNPLKSKPYLLAGAMPRAIESFDFSEYDIVLSGSGAFSHGIITGPNTIHICYCHTPMRYAWDWHHENIRERGLDKFGLKFIIRKELSKLRIWDSVAVNRVDLWLGNSGVVSSRIAKYYRVPAKVVYPPVDTDFYDPALIKGQAPPIPYAVTASRLTANKHIELMVAASAKTGLALRIIGKGEKEDELRKLAEELAAPVTFLGYLSEEEKREQIGMASCFLFAAEDDFGIAPVEALSLGTPVISLHAGGITEVINEGKNGYFFETQTSKSLSNTIQKFLLSNTLDSTEKIRESALAYSTHVFKDKINKIVSDAYQKN